MLDKLERGRIYVNLYIRYMDDISIITDVINKEDTGRIFMRLDPVGILDANPVNRATGHLSTVPC